ncbi:MAG TPA: hypothetical protein ENG41_04010 [Methanomicrobia archaeon]|nr:hypothetical protein [Methanomicrobia archaeon]
MRKGLIEMIVGICMILSVPFIPPPPPSPSSFFCPDIYDLRAVVILCGVGWMVIGMILMFGGNEVDIEETNGRWERNDEY